MLWRNYIKKEERYNIGAGGEEYHAILGREAVPCMT